MTIVACLLVDTALLASFAFVDVIVDMKLALDVADCTEQLLQRLRHNDVTSVIIIIIIIIISISHISPRFTAASLTTLIGQIYQVNQKKIPPTTFVDITAMHGNFCTKFYTIVKIKYTLYHQVLLKYFWN